MSTAASHIELLIASWQSGTRAVAYYGPVRSEIFLRGAPSPQELHRAYLRLKRRMRQRAHKQGNGRATHCVGVEETMDPWAERGGETGLLLASVGTAAELVALAKEKRQ